jgi:hypothetical protein
MVGEEGFEPTWLSANGFTVRRNNTIVAAPPQAGINIANFAYWTLNWSEW